MDDKELKSIWDETLASDSWDAADVGQSYGSSARQTADYSDAPRRFRPRLPRATFTGEVLDAALGDALQQARVAAEQTARTQVLEPSAAGDRATIAYDVEFSASEQEANATVASSDEPALTSLVDAPSATTDDDPLVSGATIAGHVGGSMESSGLSTPSVVIHHQSTDPGRAARRQDRISGIELTQSHASYNIKSELGRGGMGIVYRAVQGSLDREVAIKTLVPEKRNERSRDKFIAEALVTGGLDHPNVVPVHELGRADDGEVFLAMKLVHGRSWQELLHPHTEEDRAVSSEWTLNRHIDVLLQVANAVSYAHSKGIIHRDLKPENVMVGDYGETMVMDWGIAIDVREPIPRNLRAPHKSEVAGPAGTPVYMAPEQAEGRGEHLGPWTDVYLLGAILHEVITGQAPHHRPGSRLLDVLVTAARSEPPTYSDDVPRALQQICHKALARAPADRYQTVAELRDVLQTWIGHRASLRLADEADALAATVLDGVVLPRDAYAVFTRALARYEQALVTWPENAQALRGQAHTALAYADEAMARKDYGVVEAQLTLIEGNPYTDDERLLALHGAVSRQGRGRIRTAVALALILLGSVAAYQGLDAVALRAQQRGAQQAAEHGFNRKAQEAWEAVARADLLAVSRAETRLAEDPLARRSEGGDRVKSVRGAKKLMLWQQQRYQELFNIQCRDFRRGLEEAGADFSAVDPRLSDTLVGALLTRAADDPSSRSMCNVFETELVSGTAPKIVLAAFDEMQRAAPESAQKRLRRRRRLLDAATCEIAPNSVELAAMATDTDPCLLATLPFTLALPPVGPRLAKRSRPPVMRRGEHHEWVALDPRTRKERWRTLPPGEDAASEVVVPVSDGSVIIGGGAFLRRHDGATGRVLGRIVLPSRPILAWPDSLDRRRMRVIAWTNYDQGRVAVLTYAGGRAYQPTFKSDTLEQWWRTSPTVLALEQRLIAAEQQRLGLPADNRDAPVRVAVFEQLMTQARDDPFEPDLPIRALALAQNDIPKPRLEQVADAAVQACKGLLPVHVVRIGNALSRAGFADRADLLYDQAARDFMDAHGNADFASLRIGNPAFLLRQLGGELFAAGHEQQALALVAKGRQFATVIEGDARFYQRYLGWLQREGRTDGDGTVAKFASIAARAGGVLVLAPDDFLLTDISAVTVVLAPLLLLLLLLRLWWSARSSRIAALSPHGLRNGRDRFYAFLSDPWLRLRHTFWSYCSRAQRFMVLVTALVAVGSASTLVSNISILGRSSTAPLHVSFGYPGQPAFLYDVRSAVERKPGDASLLRLLAEALRARGRDEDAKATLQKVLAANAADPIAFNNLGVLHEEAGELEKARLSYTKAADTKGEVAQLARWNLARIEGAELPTAALAHRDRLRARHFGPDKPLWVTCPLEDQRRLLVPPESLTERALQAFAQLIRGDFGNVVATGNFGGDRPLAELWRSSVAAASLISLICAALALLWLPLTTLPLLREPDAVADTRGALGRGLFGIGRVLELLIPGMAGLLRGNAALGAAVLLLLCVLAGTWVAVDLGGLVGELLALEGFAGYFEGIPAPSLHLRYKAWGDAAGIGLIVAFVGNLALQLRKGRRLAAAKS